MDTIDLLTCSYHSEHGFWPVQHHQMALAFARRDHPRNPKYQRMVQGNCPICGSSLKTITVNPVTD